MLVAPSRLRFVRDAVKTFPLIVTVGAGGVSGGRLVYQNVCLFEGFASNAFVLTPSTIFVFGMGVTMIVTCVAYSGGS